MSSRLDNDEYQNLSLFSSKSVSSEGLFSDDSLSWSFDIWSDHASAKAQYPFRSDRSMSLTDNYLPRALPNKLKGLDIPPPPGFPPLATQPSNRYKTELCHSYQENGNCKYGNKCQFAHGESELRGLHRHPKYKTEACRTFYKFGYCPYGGRCHFIHEEKRCSLLTQNQKPHSTASQHPRLLRQSVSFAGFLGARSTSPPLPYEYEPLGFSRALSVSPPPTDFLSPTFNDANREKVFFSPNHPEGEDQLLPSLPEPQKSARRASGQGLNFLPALNKFTGKENRSGSYGFGHVTMQRFASDDSLSDHESYSSTGSSSGTESPTFENTGTKRLMVFTRMSLSE